MKKVTKLISMLVLSTFLVFTSPMVVAQTTGETTTTATTDDRDNDDDGGRWGLAGLLGLLGLLGLRRRDDDRTRTTTNVR